MSKPLNAYEEMAKSLTHVEFKSARPSLMLHQFQQDALKALGLDGERRYTVARQSDMDQRELLEGIERLKQRLLEPAARHAADEFYGEFGALQMDQIRKTLGVPRELLLTAPKPFDPWWPRVTGGKTKIGPTDV